MVDTLVGFLEPKVFNFLSRGITAAQPFGDKSVLSDLWRLFSR
jgi:hypothetical protein